MAQSDEVPAAIEGSKIPFPRFQAYVTESFHWVPSEVATASRIRNLVKWFFDLLKNAVVAGVLKYLADKTNSALLHTLAGFSFTLLLAYCWSYINTWHIAVFHGLQNKKLAAALDLALNVLLCLALWYAIMLGISVSIDEVAKGQMK
jgi:hypothetical protein